MKQLMVILLLAASVSACGERDQSLGATRKFDSQSWQAAPTAYAAKGWTGGEKAVWETQLRTRAQTQNEYAKVN